MRGSPTLACWPPIVTIAGPQHGPALLLRWRFGTLAVIPGRAVGREPGIHDSRPVVMDSGPGAYAPSRNDERWVSSGGMELCRRGKTHVPLLFCLGCQLIGIAHVPLRHRCAELACGFDVRCARRARRRRRAAAGRRRAWRQHAARPARIGLPDDRIGGPRQRPAARVLRPRDLAGKPLPAQRGRPGHPQRPARAGHRPVHALHGGRARAARSVRSGAGAAEVGGIPARAARPVRQSRAGGRRLQCRPAARARLDGGEPHAAGRDAQLRAGDHRHCGRRLGAQRRARAARRCRGRTARS